MLYLAEVQRRPTGFGLGGGKTDLKLLACQRSENNWLAVPGEEVIPADEAKEFSPGALVLVDLDNNKQVLQIQDAGRQLVKILQNFSCFQSFVPVAQELIISNLLGQHLQKGAERRAPCPGWCDGAVCASRPRAPANRSS